MKKERMGLDVYDRLPEDMENYLRHNGWHFSKKAAEWAIKKMRKSDGRGGTKKVEMKDGETVREILKKHGVELENNVGWDDVYVFHKGMADCFQSSIPDEYHLALSVKDAIDDVDAPDGLVFAQWYCMMVRKGERVDWEEIL